MSGDRCGDKFPWRTREEAERQLRTLKHSSQRNKKLVNKLDIYQCPTCHHWHIGTNRWKRKRLFL